MNKSDNEVVWYILLKIFYDNNCEKWNQMRALLNDEAKTEDIDAYLHGVFAAGVKERLLKTDTPLFRARQIKSRDSQEIGLIKERIIEQTYATIIKPEDVELFDSIDNLNVPLDDILLCKLAETNGFTFEQLSKLSALNKKYSKHGFYGFSAAKSGIPPKKFRKDQRLSTKNDRYLYLAMDEATAIYEMRPAKNQIYSVAKGTLNQPAKLADLQDVSKYEDIADFELGNLISKISEPNTDNDLAFYRITQRLSHYIKSQGLDGIVYNSSIRQDGINVLLFNPKSVKFTETSVISIDSIKIDYHTDYPLKNED